MRDVTFNETGRVAAVSPTTRIPRCGACGCKARRIYDERERGWRHLDLAAMMLTLRYSPRRVRCRLCGVIAERVPWAQHGSGFTLAFEEHSAWLTQRADRTTVSTLLRVAWRTVGRVVARVVERLGPRDRLEGLDPHRRR